MISSNRLYESSWVELKYVRLFLQRVSRFLPGTTRPLKAILHSRDINVAGASLTPPSPWPTLSSVLHPPYHRDSAAPAGDQSGGKQWRDVGHENGSAFVAGNCLSFCYFAASKSQTSAGDFWERGNVFSQNPFYLVFLTFGIKLSFFS